MSWLPVPWAWKCDARINALGLQFKPNLFRVSGLPEAHHVPVTGAPERNLPRGRVGQEEMTRIRAASIKICQIHSLQLLGL